MVKFNVVLFDGFETLDAMGPAEIVGKMPTTYSLQYFSLHGGLVTSSQNVQVYTSSLHQISKGILLVPGGMGTRTLVDDSAFIHELTRVANISSYVLTVCTGSALLAKTGLLQGRHATSNKGAFGWVQSVHEGVLWEKQARWVVDGNFYTSSGVSAGMDMMLGFIADLHGQGAAENIAKLIEYIWNADKNHDPFAV